MAVVELFPARCAASRAGGACRPVSDPGLPGFFIDPDNGKGGVSWETTLMLHNGLVSGSSKPRSTGDIFRRGLLSVLQGLLRDVGIFQVPSIEVPSDEFLPPLEDDLLGPVIILGKFSLLE